MNPIPFLVIACCVAVWLPSPAGAEENEIVNIRPQRQVIQPVQPAPNTSVILPGTTVINPSGVTPVPAGQPDQIIVPDNRAILPDTNVQISVPDTSSVQENKQDLHISPEINVTAPDTNLHISVPETPPAPENRPAQPSEPGKEETPSRANVPVVVPDVVPVPEGTVPANAAPPTLSPVQLWQLMPLTTLPKDIQNKPKEKTEPPQTARPSRPEKKKGTEKPKEAPKKEAPKPARDAPVRSGEPLRIPEKAMQTGNLDFLEGCWQGTRPEYYSKRIVKECFCFGKGGGSGKRRVDDPRGGRTCFGSTRASMAGRELRVSSEGAYCSDGARWGAAHMTCRGSGQNTPCSWVFLDAEGGRQSYEIPFIRVESCGGRGR